ncbi:MAG: amidohydrolase family protein [Lachnospiraceae bacterium]|nr:amidohydrolase family protein [Lachnospiraceae bacterium]
MVVKNPAATIRDTLLYAKKYWDEKEYAEHTHTKKPHFDPKLEALRPVIKKEIPLKAHVLRTDDIFTAIRIARECDVRLTLEHATEGGLIADLLAEEGWPIAVGPYLGEGNRYEHRNQGYENAVKLIKAGCMVSSMTDSVAIAEQYLTLCAGMLVREGLDEFEALKTITIHPAKHLGIEQRVGTLEKGRDADLVLMHGSPFSITAKPKAVFIEGKRV